MIAALEEAYPWRLDLASGARKKRRPVPEGQPAPDRTSTRSNHPGLESVNRLMPVLREPHPRQPRLPGAQTPGQRGGPLMAPGYEATGMINQTALTPSTEKRAPK